MTELVHAAVDRRQTMKMANDLFPLFKEKLNQCTFRKGECHISLGDLLFISTDPEGVENYFNWMQEGGEIYHTIDGVFLAQTVEVDIIVIKPFAYFSDKELAEDGFKNQKTALEIMRRFYPDLKLDTPMTMIYFEVPE